MEFMLISIGTSILGFIGYLVMNALVKVPGAVKQAQFSNLGVVKGKTYAEIIEACGNPSSVSPIGDGNKVCQWMATGYHIALVFDENDICLGISHEASV